VSLLPFPDPTLPPADSGPLRGRIRNVACTIADLAGSGQSHAGPTAGRRPCSRILLPSRRLCRGMGGPL